MQPLDRITIHKALRRMGELLDRETPVELLLVGGAAGILTGALPVDRYTIDCDVMDYAPPEALGAVELAAGKVAAEMSLRHDWLNSDVQIRRDTLPDGWRERRVLVGKFGRLHVYAAGRFDLIAMKIVAGRPQDLDDLGKLAPTNEELDRIAGHLALLSKRGTRQDQIDEAMTLLESLRNSRT